MLQFAFENIDARAALLAAGSIVRARKLRTPVSSGFFRTRDSSWHLKTKIALRPDSTTLFSPSPHHHHPLSLSWKNHSLTQCDPLPSSCMAAGRHDTGTSCCVKRFRRRCCPVKQSPTPTHAGRITRYLQVVWPLVAMAQEPVIVTRDFESDAALTQRFPPNERRVFC